MTTADKDFKVKNGLVVGAGGTFNGTVVVSTPTENNHAATKLYVDQNAGGGGGGYTVSDTAPESPSEGDVWFRSTDAKEFIYYDSYWVEMTQGDQGVQGIEGSPGSDGGFDSAQTVQTVGTSRALTSADAGKLILNSAAITITVEGLTVGQQVDFLQNVADQITFVAGSGITLNSKGGKLKTDAQYSPVGIKCVATNTYVLVGDLGA